MFKGLSILAGYAFALLITRNLGAHAMGIFALSLTVLNIAALFGRLGLGTALLRFIAEYSSQDRPEMVKEVYVQSIKMLVPFSSFNRAQRLHDSGAHVLISDDFHEAQYVFVCETFGS